MSFNIEVYMTSFNVLITKVFVTKLSNCILSSNSSYFDCGFLLLYRNTSKLSKTKTSIAFSEEQSASRNSSTLKR